MKLKDILQGIEILELQDNRTVAMGHDADSHENDPMNIEVNAVHTDSRRVTTGDMFIAVRGTQVDGHKFIENLSIDYKGLTVILVDRRFEELPVVNTAGLETVAHTAGTVFVRVADTGQSVGKIATNFYGNPTSKLKLVGVTGTNGKTTIATLLYQLFRRFGYKCGLCSTVCNYVDGQPYPTEQTTPDPLTLNKLLHDMVEAGCEYAFMEVSSHAVVQNRIGGLTFAGGIFTNLTRDHLDYHKTFEDYRNAKKGFFDRLPREAFAITNADDKNGMFMLQNTEARQVSYSTRSYATFTARIVEESFEGMLLDMRAEYKEPGLIAGTYVINEAVNRCYAEQVSMAFIGRFNVSNLLAVYGTAVMLGADPHQTLVEMSALRPVNGRFETIRSPKGVTAIVDYAHTPDALVNVLSTINEILNHRGQCITVCGCGGNRDKGKRPIMACVSADNSDRVIITSDNPRNEEPQDIINDMLAGLDAEQMKRVIAIADRREAIRAAIMMAQPGDVVLIAGKGHEDYQIIKGVKHHFDDHEVVREVFGL